MAAGLERTQETGTRGVGGRVSWRRWRRWLPWVLPVLCLGVWYFTQVTPNRLRLRRQTIAGSSLRVPVSRPLRVLHLSDLHLGSRASVRRLRQAVQLGLSTQPDLVVITGDFGWPGDAERAEASLGLLVWLAEQVPVFACFGNHDRLVAERLRRVCVQAGIVLLENAWRDVVINGQSYRIVGLGDSHWQPVAMEACLPRLATAPEAAVPILLLFHNPAGYERRLRKLCEYQWDMVFSGHTHGGQFKVPWLEYYPLAPVENKRRGRGLFPLPGGRMLCVSAGIGSYVDVRINSDPEVSLWEIVP